MANNTINLEFTVKLSNGVAMPRLGFGVYLSPKNQCTTSCLSALEAGYRHIDTAQYYDNEEEVGQAIKKSGISRGEVFITTKILGAKGSAEKTCQNLLESVQALDGPDGYVDLYLVHSPPKDLEGRAELWLALQKLYKAGKARSIGVSNYGIGHIEEMKSYATVWPPHVNQLELHPWCQQKEIEAYCRKEGIIVEAYCPLVRNMKAEDSVLNEIARNHDVPTAKVLVRYALQKGWVPLPKSDTPSRIVANSEVYDFELEENEMRKLDALDEGAEGSICCAVNNKL